MTDGWVRGELSGRVVKKPLTRWLKVFACLIRTISLPRSLATSLGGRRMPTRRIGRQPEGVLAARSRGNQE
jgi:hypothetical protein